MAIKKQEWHLLSNSLEDRYDYIIIFILIFILNNFYIKKFSLAIIVPNYLK